MLPQLSYEAVRPQLQGERLRLALTPAGWKRARHGTDSAAEPCEEKAGERRYVLAFSAPRDNAARAGSGNGGKSELMTSVVPRN